MKKIIILFLVLCGAGLGTSCDDFLTEHPSTQFSPEDVYSSPNGVQAVLNSCYGYISQSNGYGGYLHMLLSWHTPTMQLQNRNSTYMVELATMNVAVDNSTADYVYDGAYQTINTVNDLLMNIGLCSGMSEAEHNRIEGEARLLRALSYFNLVRIFGALPYIDRPAASIEESHKPRTSIDRIYGLIIGDLEQAWNMLPEKGAHAHGRPHKWAAKAFLAKVYVALACIKEHPGEPFDAALFDKSAKEYWQLAYDNAKEVYDSHAYSLVPNFADLWVYTNKHTEESILEMEMNYVTGSCPFMYRYLPGYWEGVPLTNSSNNYGFEPMDAIPHMLGYQRGAAENTGAAFWPTCDAMRSLGGMEQFVANGWAGKDFTHINYAGGRRVAWSLFDALNAGAFRAYTEAEAARIRRQAEQAMLDSLRRRRIERDLIPGIPPETLNAPLK